MGHSPKSKTQNHKISKVTGKKLDDLGMVIAFKIKFHKHDS